jgi:hypothetical protein
MTILEPNKYQGVNRAFWTVMAILLLVTAWSILIYNHTVLLSHELRAKEQAYKAAAAKNIELKNERYAQTEGKVLQKIASSRGLVKVRTPGYINVHNALLAIDAMP